MISWPLVLFFKFILGTLTSFPEAQGNGPDKTPGQPPGAVPLSTGEGVAVSGVGEGDSEMRRTAQLVATCTAAATAAVLKATRLPEGPEV
jgi:hypothetical protein